MTNDEFDKYCQRIAKIMPDPILLSDRIRQNPNTPLKGLTGFKNECMVLDKFTDRYKKEELKNEKLGRRHRRNRIHR